MSRNKRSEIKLTQVKANTALRMFKTLRRLELAKPPIGQYTDAKEVFNVWDFAKKYGVKVGE